MKSKKIDSKAFLETILGAMSADGADLPHVEVVGPSRQMLRPDGTPDTERRERALENLRGLGLQVGESPVSYLNEARFAGSDRLRADEFQEILNYPVDLVLALRGGYGATRLLPLIDWDALRYSATPFMGYSDATALQTALYVRARRPSWHGPTLSSFDDPHPDTVEAFRKALAAGHDLTRWEGLEWDPGEGLSEIPPEPIRAEGLLWGGNLSVLTGLIGTPWFDREAFRGGILFLEETGEAAYRIERMLLTLIESGVLSDQKAIVWGDVLGADRPVAFPGDFSFAHVADYLRSRGAPPMVSGLPMGHGPRKCAVPFGIRVRLTVTPVSASLVPVR